MSDPDKQVPAPEPREFQRVRVWKHGSGGLPDCPRKDKPVYTPPNKIPDECRRCPNDEWVSQGVKTRDKKTKQIISD